ncbi:MAG TPA: class I SAM-dependent methyltransferase [Ktedonobacterales bacterium]|jgi:arsenite methyltransferase|nr:class I SAM-dependent methyltransferase [Ktedonobacterales bacterium]
MTQQGGRLPPFGTGEEDWDDWDPTRARSGYTGHVRALRDLDLARPGGPLASGIWPPGPHPVIDLPAPLPRQQPAAADALGPAGLAAGARAETEDFLTITYDPRDPGFAELYDAVVVPQWSLPFGRLLLSAFLTLPRDSGWQVLDVACGTGYPALELARFLGQDCDLAGMDTWEEAIQIARRKASEQWLRNVSFVVADVMGHSLPEGAFDTITCNLGLTSFADRAGALGAMWRLLRPSGQLLLTLPLQAAMREFLDTYYLTLRDLRLESYMRDLSQLVASRPTVEQAHKLVERAGFEVQRTLTETFALRFPTPRAFLTSPVIQTTYMESWRAVVPDLTVRRLVFNEVERRLQARIQASGGELRLTVPMLCVCAVRA